MESSRARRPLLWGTAALAVAAVAALVAVALAASGPGPPPPDGITLEVDRAWARAGETIQLRVLVPGGGRSEREAGYGVPSTLERRVGERWVPTHHLGFGLGWGSSEPYYARYGDPKWGWFPIAFHGDRWRPLAIPPDAEPGLHRIVMVGVPGRPFAVSLYVS